MITENFLNNQLEKLKILKDEILKEVRSKSFNLNLKETSIELGKINLGILQIENDPRYYGLCWKCRNKIEEITLKENPTEIYCKSCKKIKSI